MQPSQPHPNVTSYSLPNVYQSAHTPQQMQTQAAASSKRPRHRASIVCASCRNRHIRCVTRPGESDCLNCKRTGIACIILNNDMRRKPISRAYVASLTDRIALLEGLLERKGDEPPSSIHPPRIRPGLPGSDEPQPEPTLDFYQKAAPLLQSEYSFLSKLDDGAHQSARFQSATQQTSSPRLLNPVDENQSLVNQLLAAKGHLRFDQSSGSVRFFGSFMSNYLTSNETVTSMSPKIIEHTRCANQAIRLLPQETHNCLMDLFWEHFNSILHVIQKEAFLEDYGHGSSHFYSPFLHICILAVGFLYSDQSRPDTQGTALGLRESTLHREAKHMLNVELERPGGIAQVQALLLLATCEYTLGRDYTGWLYSGMAVRLAFDIGLHLETRLSGLPEREVDIRHMTLWACVISDKNWSMLLGRSTGMTSSDIEVSALPKRFERLATCLPNGPGLLLEIQIYEALIDLVEIAGRASENRKKTTTTGGFNRSAYGLLVAVDLELKNWYARLPKALSWEPSNIQSAPRSFFILHQEHHSVRIQILRPFARYEEAVSPVSKDVSKDGVIMSTRKACTNHAMAVVRNFWHYRQRFSTKQIFCSALQTAGTACTTLIADLASVKDAKGRENLLKYLKFMVLPLQEMANIYQPAERMCLALQHVLAELAQKNPQEEDDIIPASRQSTEDDIIQNIPKRRQQSDPRPTSILRRSEWSYPVQVRSTTDHVSSRPDNLSETGSVEANFPFAPQSHLGGWPFPSPNGQTDGGGPSLPNSAPTMYESIPPNARVAATSHVPDTARMGFSNLPAISEDGTQLGHIDFLL